MSQILIVEDNAELRRELKDLLLSQHYHVFCASTRVEALQTVQRNNIDLCLMDVGLTDCTGFELCREMRKYYNKSIIMLTAYDQEDDMVEGFACGADDYIIKPFSIKILLTRVEAQLRTAQRQADLPEIFFTGDLQIDFTAHVVKRNGKLINLGSAEFDILNILVRNSGKVVARKCFLQNVWDLNGKFIEDNTLSVHMSRLRKALGTYHGGQYIETVKKHGYRWVSPQAVQNEVCL